MDTLTSEQVGVTQSQSALRIAGLCRGHKADGRAMYDPAAKRSLIALCRQPGISVARAALENGINANLLRKWIRASQRGVPKAKSSPSAARAAQSTQTKVPIAQALLPRCSLRLSDSASGMPCIDRLLLATLIDLLSQAPGRSQA